MVSFDILVVFCHWVVTVRLLPEILCIEESKSITFLVRRWNQGLTFYQLTGSSLGDE